MNATGRLSFSEVPIVLTGCGENNESRPVTLYKYSVSSGNGVVTFLTYNDINGSFSMEHCEVLKQAYLKKYNEQYVCAIRLDNDYLPDVKWKNN